jgi:hypothetical protein
MQELSTRSMIIKIDTIKIVSKSEVHNIWCLHIFILLLSMNHDSNDKTNA